MDAEKLVRMANQIAQFYAPYPDQDEACQAISLHLQRFWTPAMRQTLLARLSASPESGLQPLAARACAQLEPIDRALSR